MARLIGRKALVIGGASGIGRAVCEMFAEEGADVAVADVHDDRLDVARSCADQGVDAVALGCDVRDEGSVARCADAAAERFGHLDIVVNNAGVAPLARPFCEQDWSSWDKVIAVNLTGVAFGTKHALRYMLPRRFGRIINTASQLAHKPSPGVAAYCASKAAIVALSASVAQEVAASGITVNCVCPGPTDTPMWRASDATWIESKLASLPIGRVGLPREVAAAYVFLASDDAAFMVGQSISPNGGDVAW